MSLAEIEANLEKLTADELRHLAVRSWSAFIKKESGSDEINQCDEEAPELLATLDKALARAEKDHEAYDADHLRAQVKRWTSK